MDVNTLIIGNHAFFLILYLLISPAWQIALALEPLLQWKSPALGGPSAIHLSLEKWILERIPTFFLERFHSIANEVIDEDNV